MSAREDILNEQRVLLMAYNKLKRLLEKCQTVRFYGLNFVETVCMFGIYGASEYENPQV